ncbi:Uma2 family endonuclease [Cyanobacteria bacterium FACHB-471]|nr:Uma2 family endonuclease [Cyanobacteria bacterium FACHB-471]
MPPFCNAEFSNTSLSKDTEIKRKTYAMCGIPEYWVMDLKHHQLKVFRDPASGDYQSERVLTAGTINPLAFPEVEISVQQLLEG